MSDKRVERKYVRLGARFGDAVSYIPMGECIGFRQMLRRWADWEREYAGRGYKTVPLDDLIELGGYGKSIDSVLGQKRPKTEEPIFHAQIFLEKYPGEISPLVDFNKLMPGQVQSGTYALPSTRPSQES